MLDHAIDQYSGRAAPTPLAPADPASATPGWFAFAGFRRIMHISAWLGVCSRDSLESQQVVCAIDLSLDPILKVYTGSRKRAILGLERGAALGESCSKTSAASIVESLKRIVDLLSLDQRLCSELQHRVSQKGKSYSSDSACVRYLPAIGSAGECTSGSLWPSGVGEQANKHAN